MEILNMEDCKVETMKHLTLLTFTIGLNQCSIVCLIDEYIRIKRYENKHI